MWFSKHRNIVLVIALLGAVLAVAAVIRGPRIVESVTNRIEARACASKGGTDDDKDNCFVQIALKYIRNGDVSAAYRAFDYLYDAYPLFGSWGCHVNAHRLGDTAYYEFFVTHGLSLPQMDFPQETTSCGYGFFHGFLEHMTQDHPQPSFVKETCEYLRGRLSENMHDIARVCYHASGHGFIQSVADTLKKDKWGDVAWMVNAPLKKCEALPGISEQEVEECREGVFNVMSDWMIEKNFGLAFDFKNPFKDCDGLIQRWHWACYYEFGQKLQPVIGDDVLSASKYVGGIKETDIRDMTFGVIVAGMMQRLAPLDGYPNVFKDCTKVTDDALFKACIVSATNGMMEHGDPGNEYAKILPMCALGELNAREGTSICYDTLARRLSRFYGPDKKKQVCGMFPAQYKEACIQAP
ncbi:hypothetical protein K8R03_02810 [Candidatus Kaiserbacteria bacterium]|nr:hypothetical protein [Candidatus Kaiserbacteria bacterium]